MWELYAMWTWIAVFATASFAAAGLGQRRHAAGSIAAFLAIASGAAGCSMAGYLADRARQGARRDVVDAGERRVRGADGRRLRRSPMWCSRSS